MQERELESLTGEQGGVGQKSGIELDWKGILSFQLEAQSWKPEI